MQTKDFHGRPCIVEAQLRNLTTRELIKYCDDHSDDPVVDELTKRLELCLDFVTKQVGL
jgi:hypothetical protein